MKKFEKNIDDRKVLVARISQLLASAGGASIAAAGSAESGMLARLMEAVSGAGSEGAGDITIPVYIGQDRIDEIVVTAAQRAAYRSGGR